MRIKQNLTVATLMTVVTTVILGSIYPLVVTGVAQVLFPDQANGQLIERHGTVIGSRLIGIRFLNLGMQVSARNDPGRTGRRECYPAAPARSLRPTAGGSIFPESPSRSTCATCRRGSRSCSRR